MRPFARLVAIASIGVGTSMGDERVVLRDEDGRPLWPSSQRREH